MVSLWVKELGIVVLEELDHAKARGAKIYGEIKGYGMSGDAHHITAPADDGDGGFRAMQAALNVLGWLLGDIDYVNAHGTSTPLGDIIEAKAVARLLGDASPTVSISSTKVLPDIFWELLERLKRFIQLKRFKLVICHRHLI